VPLRVLLVDDDPLVRAIGVRALQLALPEGSVVLEAANGESAIHLLESTDVDAIVTDYRMGRVSGTEVLVHALSRRPLARRVLMSNFADDAIVRAARERALIHEFFEKPLLSSELASALVRAVAGREPNAAG